MAPTRQNLAIRNILRDPGGSALSVNRVQTSERENGHTYYKPASVRKPVNSQHSRISIFVFGRSSATDQQPEKFCPGISRVRVSCFSV